MGDSNIIREGFICSECHAAFSGVEELLKHYEKDHQETTTIKALLGKAKQKFTKDLPQSFSGNPFLPPGSSNSETVSAPTYVYEPQKPGVTVTHAEYFKACRKAKVERYASEGNKLLIRLQKLCDNIPDDPFKRKAHEQSVVSWIDEKAVSRCPECAEQFNMILRRKHHCRLCGSILCDDCSLFLRLDDAKSLTKTLSSHNSSFSQDRNKKRDEISLRICTHCCNILESRRGNYEVSDEGKKLEVLHAQLQEILHRTESLIPELEKTVDSLNAGESLYSTQQANSQRADILKLTEKVDLISKKIMTSSGDNSSDVLLRQRIRSSTVISIRNLLLTLPQIPGDEHLAKLKMEAMQGVQVKKTGRAEVVKSAGWVGDLKNVPLVDDPIEQQIINLKEVMEQAKAAGKEDEVEMLAQSIRDLLAYKQANQ